MRHAVQQRAISDPAQHPLGAAGTDEAARWQAAELTYDDDALDLTAYAYNGLETDAYGVERAVLMAYWRHAYVRFGRRLWRAR
jgi:hypothetical protein